MRFLDGCICTCWLRWLLMLSMDDILIDAIECAIRLISPTCEYNMSGDSNGLFNDDPNVVFIMKIWRVKRFCHTAFSSVDGARNIIFLRFALFNGVRVKSGVQWTVGLSNVLPFGSIVRRNSVSEYLIRQLQEETLYKKIVIK